MRNFFKPATRKAVARNSSPGIKYKNGILRDILDTDEDRVINQYNIYRNYISRIKGELLRSGARLIGYRKRVSA